MAANAPPNVLHPTPGNIGLYAAKLLEFLEHRTEAGETILTDDQLTKACGFPTGVGGKGYGYLRTAIKRIRKSGVIWERINGANAIERITDDSRKVGLATNRQKRVGREAKRTLAILGCVDLQKLPDAEHAGFHAKIYINSAIASMTTKASEKKLLVRDTKTMGDPSRLLENIIASNGGV